MSKAFTRESDAQDERPAAARLRSPLPPGAKNYMTPEGAARLRAELDAMRGDAQADAVRMRALEESLRTAEIVEPQADPDGAIRFGATITIRRDGGEPETLRIVGIDEVDAGGGCVSWLSPLARVLLDARVGDVVELRLPSGVQEVEIVDSRPSIEEA
jgi:transcription elongation factor GreB